MRGFSCIGLHKPKSAVNVGAVMRAAGCYESRFVAQSGRRFSPKALTDPQKRYRHMPHIHVDDLSTVIPYDCVPVAVDLIEGAASLVEYKHPERAFYIFGPEDGTLGREVTGWCRDTIYIPTDLCMNLAATVNVVLYDRLAKQIQREECNTLGTTQNT